VQGRTYAKYERSITKDDVWLATIAISIIVVALAMIANSTSCRVQYLDTPLAAAAAATTAATTIMNAHRHACLPACCTVILHLYLHRTEMETQTNEAG